MKQRLLWNFEFKTRKNNTFCDLKNTKEEILKWEARFFWPEQEIICLSLIDEALLEIAHYQYKQKQHYYYLIPAQNYNIKYRRDELLYKPLIEQSPYAFGFGAKINITQMLHNPHSHTELNIKKLVKQIEKGVQVLVKKDSFTYKFAFQPSIKLELARIEVNDIIFFSLCIEGRSRRLVETMSRCLLGEKPTSDYVHFLKKIVNND